MRIVIASGYGKRNAINVDSVNCATFLSCWVLAPAVTNNLIVTNHYKEPVC
jgi:hypothetical protein